MARPAGNSGSTERFVSLLAGLGLTSLAILAVRGSRRVRSGVSLTAARQIDSLHSLYVAELQELNSAEAQLSAILQKLAGTLGSQDLESHFLGYATELHARHEDLERILGSRGVDPAAHPDDAMHALIRETEKMHKVCAPAVRDAAVLSSVQRLVHFKIAGYGTVATYAKCLGLIDDAARLGEYADRDKELDQELSTLAKVIINPAAATDAQPREDRAGEMPRHR
jgi:ferritin-like metal-binding protein YciE